jgi:hypothetical protein
MYSVELTIPFGVQPGLWRVSKLTLQDNSNKTRDYNEAELPDKGVLIESKRDASPPSLVGLSMPHFLNATSRTQTIHITATLSDDLQVDVEHFMILLKSPSLIDILPLHNIIAYDTKGKQTKVYGEITVPTYVETGLYAVLVTVQDVRGNSVTYSGEQLGSLGVPSKVLILSNEDIEGPVVQSLQVTPDVFDTSRSDVSVCSHKTFPALTKCR